ncbi:MAG: hypothetical protein Q8R82_00115 [Hyphomonadaceae bacterium]|nr:hypothetical protein [Hyphomonadaceae bacterium]
MTTEIAAEAAAQPQPEERPRLSVRMGWGSAIFQAALVVVGVLLGLAVTEWQADAREQDEAQHALSGIIEEIGANTKAIAEARAYHEAKLVAMAEAQKANTKLDFRTFDRGFVAPAQVSSAAWTSASEVGALSHLPFDQVLSLSKVYAQQAAYMQQQATVSSVIYTEIFARGTEGMLEHAAGLRAIISTFQYREQQLETAYAAAIGQYTATMP